MSFSNFAEDGLLDLLFSATTLANIAQNATTSPLTQWAVALHTADPGDAGSQTTSEAAYASYARVNVSRSGGWTASSGGSVSPAADITFPASTGAGSTITNWSVGKTGGGATSNLASGVVTPTIAVGASGIQPILAASSTSISLD